MKGDRNFDKIDGVWKVSGKLPRPGSKRDRYRQFAISRMGLNAAFHKRSLVKELFALAQLTGPCEMFTSKECRNDKNIHARLDGLLKRGYFTVDEDYSVENPPQE